LKVFRCRICGEVYLGAEKPASCPFCGAHDDYLVLGRDWVDENKGLELTSISRENLEKALQLEVDNAAFYYSAYQAAKDIEIQGMFKSLSKVEAEHASAISKMLKISKPDITEVKELAAESDEENLRRSLAREERASKFYGEAAKEAQERRVQEFFIALSEIERDHIQLDQIELERV
jgi:rubrerythrin